MKTRSIESILNKRVVILDGAMGTELQKRGMPDGVCVEAWCLDNPKVLMAIHSDYLAAGADVVYTCTFGANRRKLSYYGISNVKEVNKELALISRRVAGNKGFVAGDIGPLGEFVHPFGPLAFEDAVAIFKEQVKGLLEGGVDLFVIETMMDIQEARAALIAVREMTDAFTMVTMTYEKDARTLHGTDAVTALITLQSLGADAVGCNCSTGPEHMVQLIKSMKSYAYVPLLAKPNAGLPRVAEGKTVFDMSPQVFASFGKRFIREGANFLGGCCGSSPAHIERLKREVGFLPPKQPLIKSLSAVSSARKHVLLEREAPLVVVGERINPTGKKDLQEDLIKGKTSFIRQLAKDQEQAGADLLDVNVGVHGIDEVTIITKVVSTLAASSIKPLVIDSSNLAAIEAALRIYPGRALINSLSGEKAKLKALLPIARRYGAMFIFLPVDERGVPATFKKRKTIIERMYRKAKQQGFSKDDIVVDAIAMTIASNPEAALEAIKLIDWSSHIFHCHTIMGISNVSFGLPRRPLINAAYLAIARAHGMTMVIANPSQQELMHMKYATDALLNRDHDLAAFIADCGESISSAQYIMPVLPPFQRKVFEAVMEGRREDIDEFISQALKGGVSADTLVTAVMIPAINRVGDLFEKKEFFLPQLIASAETMKRGVEYLKPYLKQGDQVSKCKRTVVILATVKDDVHDIGKNIVALMLENHGFLVVDLGKDVSAREIIEETRRHNALIVGLSALMTTTMVNMKEVVELARHEGLACRFVFGGAVVTESYASSLGAAYARDGVEAVAVVKKIKDSLK